MEFLFDTSYQELKLCTQSIFPGTFLTTARHNVHISWPHQRTSRLNRNYHTLFALHYFGNILKLYGAFSTVHFCSTGMRNKCNFVECVMLAKCRFREAFRFSFFPAFYVLRCGPHNKIAREVIPLVINSIGIHTI